MSAYSRKYKLSTTEKEAGEVVFDYYKIIELIDIPCPYKQHAGKKILFGGVRGHKDERKDIAEAIATLERKLEELERLDNI